MADLIREAIRDRALACGFDAVGFAEAHLDAEARAGLSEFIARGYHGDMGWLAGTATRRGNPKALWPEARTVVIRNLKITEARFQTEKPEESTRLEALLKQSFPSAPVTASLDHMLAGVKLAKGAAHTAEVKMDPPPIFISTEPAMLLMVEGKPVTGTKPFKTPTGQTQPSILLTPIAITRDNLNLVVDAKWISKDELCSGVTENPPPPCK